jgi:hypothetical protein
MKVSQQPTANSQQPTANAHLLLHHAPAQSLFAAAVLADLEFQSDSAEMVFKPKFLPQSPVSR